MVSRLASDVFVSDLGWIDILGKNVRFNMVVEQTCGEGAAPERTVVARIVMPLDIVHSAIQRTLFALGAAPDVAPQVSRRLS